MCINSSVKDQKTPIEALQCESTSHNNAITEIQVISSAQLRYIFAIINHFLNAMMKDLSFLLSPFCLNVHSVVVKFDSIAHSMMESEQREMLKYATDSKYNQIFFLRKKNSQIFSWQKEVRWK